MAQNCKLFTDVQIKCSAEEFYGFYRYKMNQLVQMFPQKFHSCEFLEGNDFTTGSIMQWSYDIVGPTKMKVKVTNVDEENKSISYEVVEGDILSQYSMFKYAFRASDNGERGGATVNWLIEFEKADENVPTPEIYMEFVSQITLGLDANLAINY